MSLRDLLEMFAFHMLYPIIFKKKNEKSGDFLRN